MAYEDEWDRWSPRRDNWSSRRDAATPNSFWSEDLDSLSTWDTASVIRREEAYNNLRSKSTARVRGGNNRRRPPVPAAPRRRNSSPWREEEVYKELHSGMRMEHDGYPVGSNRRQSPVNRNFDSVEPRSRNDDRRRDNRRPSRRNEYREDYYYDDRDYGYDDYEEAYAGWSDREDYPSSIDSRLADSYYDTKPPKKGRGSWIREGKHWMRGRKEPRQPHSSRRADFSAISDYEDSDVTWRQGGSIRSDYESLDKWSREDGPPPRKGSVSPSDPSVTKGSFKVERRKYFGSRSLSSTSSAKSRTTLSTRGTGGADGLSVLTDDRTAEVAATALVEDLRAKGFQLRGDGTIYSTGSSTYNDKRKGERYANPENTTESLLGDLDSSRSGLRGSYSQEAGERYSVRQRPPNEGKSRRFSALDKEGLEDNSTKSGSKTTLTSTEGGGTREDPPRISALPSLMESLFDAQSSTIGSTNQYDHSTISTKDTRFGKNKVVLKIGKEDGNVEPDDNTKEKGENSIEASTLQTSTVGGDDEESIAKVTFGGELPPLTAYGARVPETVAKDALFGLDYACSDLSSGPNVSVKTIRDDSSGPLDRAMERFMVALRMTVANPCRS